MSAGRDELFADDPEPGTAPRWWLLRMATGEQYEWFGTPLPQYPRGVLVFLDCKAGVRANLAHVVAMVPN